MAAVALHVHRLVNKVVVEVFATAILAPAFAAELELDTALDAGEDLLAVGLLGGGLEEGPAISRMGLIWAAESAVPESVENAPITPPNFLLTFLGGVS